MVVVASLQLLVSAACFGPRTAIVLPECVERIEIEGQHSREGERKIILDHTFDLPLSRVQVTHERYEGSRKVIEEIDVVSSRPDLGHLIVGGGLGAVGAVFFGLSVGQVMFAQRSPWEAQPFYAGLFGTSALMTGFAIVSTGWHPPGDTLLRSDCAAAAPPGVAPGMPERRAEPRLDDEPDSYER